MGYPLKNRVGLWLGLAVFITGLCLACGASLTAQAGGLVVDIGQMRSQLETIATERYSDLALARTRAYLIQQLETYGYEPVSQPFGTGDSAGVNISVVRVGRQDPGHKILVGAHYDSVAGSPGADDNASGVVAALEIARLFANYPTDKTLQVVFFDQEEFQPSGTGLLGSNAFVNEATNLEGLEGAVILEMLGYACYEPGCQSYPPGLEQQDFPSRGDFIGVVGDAEHPDLLATFDSSAVQPDDSSANRLEVVTLSVPLEALSLMPDLFRSDHVPFWLQGVGAVMVSDTANFRNPHYHQASDTAETLDWVFFEQTTAYVVGRVEGLLRDG
ncbi:MAG: M28 family peptidase [Cyanobacteria bacterium P01_D01_bin.2]